MLDSFCSTYGEMVSAGKSPHVIFDATKFGNASAAIKALLAPLGIPTVSASYGNLKPWEKLPEKAKQYLLQVLPPADILTEIISSIAIYMNMSSAAVLYGDSFILDHKITTLFPNVTKRRVIEEIAESKQEITEQIKKIKQKDIKNFFVIGKLESIKLVLGISCADLKGLVHK